MKCVQSLLFHNVGFSGLATSSSSSPCAQMHCTPFLHFPWTKKRQSCRLFFSDCCRICAASSGDNCLLASSFSLRPFFFATGRSPRPRPVGGSRRDRGDLLRALRRSSSDALPAIAAVLAKTTVAAKASSAGVVVLSRGFCGLHRNGPLPLEAGGAGIAA